MPNEALLPIKVVFPRQEDTKFSQNFGGGTTVFGKVTPELRSELTGKVSAVGDHFKASFEDGLPAVMKVTLKPEAIAKTHSPTSLFGDGACPIIGGNTLGELYVSVKAEDIATVSRRLQNETVAFTANISTILDIEPFVIESDEPIVEEVRNERNKDFRVRLFRHESLDKNEKIDQAFQTLLKDQSIESAEEIDYAPHLKVFSVQTTSQQAISAIRKFSGTQSFSLFPCYGILKKASHASGKLSPKLFPPPEIGRDYGVVGIIDTGTDPNNKMLQAWVESRWDAVPRTQQDNEHGSFVAGLVVHGRSLNHGDTQFPDSSCKIVDVVALDADGLILEQNLIPLIDEAIKRYPHVKVWNLSLGDDTPCTDNEFSLLASKLDALAQDHEILFVIAAGNFKEKPFRGWFDHGKGCPEYMQERDRICAPADAIRAITVGSVAHRDTPQSRVKAKQPSPFSRCGPGPAYIMKPELSHFGGNCDATGDPFQTGVLSLDAQNRICENAGTSFATPLISSLAADTFQRLSGGNPSPTLVKAMMLHSAMLRSTPVPPNYTNYFGLGSPPDAAEIINCRQSSATIVMQVPVPPKQYFEKSPFPIPPSLIVPGKGLQGEIFMTLLYEPALDKSFGIEYCRTNIKASLGCVTADEEMLESLEIGESEDDNDEGPGYSRQVPSYPKWINDGYQEANRVKFGYKWSPMKLYYRKFKGAKVPAMHPWRLRMSLLDRAGHATEEPIDVTLIITMRSPNPEAKVYDELVAEMSKLNWAAQNLQVESTVRIRV